MRAVQLTATAGLLALPACSFLEGLAEQGITETSGPNGRLAYVIECDEFGREVADCFAAAGDLCPTGYDVIDRVSRVMTDTDIDGNVSSFEDNSLFIECK